MGPARKSRSVNKRYSYDNELPLIKDGDNTNKKNQRKKKLSDMLGPHWSKEELEHFYEAYRKHGRDWRKVAAVLRNRSAEMVEAVYSLNKAYLSLPEGTASVAGFIAMMTDYYSNMEERDCEQERNDGVGTSRKPKKRMQPKVHEAVTSDYGFLTVLKKKRSGGSRGRVVGKRTPRFPVSHSHENVKGEKYLSPTKKGLKMRRDNEEDVAHSIAVALTEASKNKRSNSMMSSPSQSAEKMYDESDDYDDREGSMEADNTDFSRDKSKERTNSGFLSHDKKGRKVRVDKKENKHLNYIREACSGTQGQNLRRNFDVEVNNAKASQGSNKRNKEENSTFDALETLANLSLMILPESNRNGIGKEEVVDDSHLLKAISSSRQKEKRKSSVLNIKRNQSISSVDDTNVASESHHLIAKVSRKRQKIVAPKISKSVATTPKESLETQVTHADQSDTHVTEIKPSNTRTTLKNKRKMHKPKCISNEQSTKVKLSKCLSNELMRRWCSFEWFYSAIDDPWFAKQEFVEYLYHVGLGHVPRLTRVEWGVIRSSLGKPRRFSDEFLKEEKEKLNQYRDSVRTHYTELRSGSRDGLPTDLARPLAVGQRVIAIHPKTREIHDGTVLTVDHDRCRVQFDRPKLGAEIIMDTDCTPLDPFENLPASLMYRTPIHKFFESLNEVKVNGLGKDQRLEKLHNMDEVASVKSSRNGQGDIISNQGKEADVEAIAELTRALDKKEAVVFELRRMNDDVLENQSDGDFVLQDSDAFQKQYAAVLVQLNQANAQVSSALFRLRQRNTYHPNWMRTMVELPEISQHTTQESKPHVNEIVEISKTKARKMVDMAIEAMKSSHTGEGEIDKAVDYVNEQLSRPSDASDIKKTELPSELITRCVASLFVIQKCTEREFPPGEVASILDCAVSSLQPCSPQNLQLYADIQKCMGIIKNQILALVPT